MELFQRAKTVRLKSRHDKYLFADEDETHVSQDRNGASPNARWSVETISHGGTEPHFLRFKSRYGRYLTASNEPFLMGVTGRKVLQTTVTGRPDSSVEWEPVREGFQVRLKTRYGNYLRANGGLPPWRNSVTHDVPHRTSTQDWVLWDVEIVEILTPKPDMTIHNSLPAEKNRPERNSVHGSFHGDVRPVHQPAMDQRRSEKESVHDEPGAYGPAGSSKFNRLESSDSFNLPIRKVEGREIYYKIADQNGNVDEAFEGHHITFNGSSLEELAEKLKEETGLDEIILCNKNILTGRLVAMRLHLPPNNREMHVVVVEASSKVAKSL
ncbi:hypothetical protein LUZ60_010474 [Juncus effusus]|nr:hypothetical protein LUZ60_010474 [Juncus effusus]